MKLSLYVAKSRFDIGFLVTPEERRALIKSSKEVAGKNIFKFQKVDMKKIPHDVKHKLKEDIDNGKRLLSDLDYYIPGIIE